MSEPSQSTRRQTGITSVTIENFKGIGAPVTIPLRPITLLFGANSAGKSTMIQAFHYAREILERDNANADVPAAGGNAIDLGGFHNMVHKHDLTRNIRIGFEITPDDDGLPDLAEVEGVDFEGDRSYWNAQFSKRLAAEVVEWMKQNKGPATEWDYKQGSELFERSQSEANLIRSSRPNANRVMRTVGLQLSIAWDGQRMRPWVNSARYLLNGQSLLVISQEQIHGLVAIGEMDAKHPALVELLNPIAEGDDNDRAGSAERDLSAFFELRSDARGWVVLREQTRVLPQLSRLNPLGLPLTHEEGSTARDFFIATIVNQIILGTTTLLKRELARFRYVGPIRERPARDHKAPAVIEEARWADGSAAWDLIVQSYDPVAQRGNAFVQELSLWTSGTDKLDLGYALDVHAQRRIPVDSMLMANLKLLRDNYEERDQEFYQKAIWPALQNTETQAALRFSDLANQVQVGPSDIGVGVIQVVPVVAASLAADKRIVALEQPELHLHPSAQAKLGDLFISQIKREKLFLLETHSELLILRLLKRIRQTTDNELPGGELALKPEDLGVLYVERSAEGARITILELDQQGEFLGRWPGQNGFFEERAKELFE
ncbi:MAG: AAA family ATPase [Verrucomicrobia bacterium]|nr:AAA family ATPase [Verrucomicrobiota bacterium]